MAKGRRYNTIIIVLVVSLVMAFCLVAPASGTGVEDGGAGYGGEGENGGENGVENGGYVEIDVAERFDDVSADDWFYDAVADMVVNGIFQGVSETEFAPNAGMTRAMFAQVLANLEGVELSAYDEVVASFDDVPAASWFFNAVEWAAGRGIVEGAAGIFNPDNPVDRQQLATMIHRYVQEFGIVLPEGEEVEFTDQDTIAFWAEEAVAAVSAAGIVHGVEGGAFNPRGTATRAQVATVFMRLRLLTIEEELNEGYEGYEDY